VRASTQEQAPTPSGPLTATAVLTPANVAILEPALPQLRSHMQYQSIICSPGGPCGYVAREETVAAWLTDLRGRLAFPAGLLPRAAALLSSWP
jgi:hypothetical protein